MRVSVYTGASTGQATEPREINNGLGFISLGSDTHMWCSLQVLTQIGTHIRSHIILDSQCLIFRVVIADDTRRTLERRKIEEGKGKKDG